MTNKRIFIGPEEIAGYYSNLTRGFRQIGVDCDYITYETHKYGYSGETRYPLLLRMARFFNKFRGKPGRPFLVRAVIALPGELLLAIWSISVIFKYDVFIFGFGHSFKPWKNRDLIILKYLGKIVISNLAHGSEARPPYLGGFTQNNDAEDKDICKETRILADKVGWAQKYAKYVIGSPFSTAYFSSKPFINSFEIGLPYVPVEVPVPTEDEKVTAEPNQSTRCTRILHSPSHPVAKGTTLITRAIESLKEKGHEIEFILIQGMPHSKVISEIQKADFVVDQLYSDTPLAGFATEAAWYGKPAVVGGYGFDYLKTLVPEDMWPPSRTCHPDMIEKAIEELMVDAEERLRLGEQAQTFVHSNWNAAEVARRYLRLIEGDIPGEWWLDPTTVTYLEGAGQSVERTVERVSQMVENYGVESLQLGHRPDLEHAFLDQIGSDIPH